MGNDVERLRTDALMEEIRQRTRGDLMAVRARELEAVERHYRAVAERPELWRNRLRDDSGHQLRTFVRFESHRGWLAPWIDFVKRRLLFPASFWLFQYGRDNFERQSELNAELLASIEQLAIENAELRRRLRQLEGGGAGRKS